jgi:hypothetical protein
MVGLGEFMEGEAGFRVNGKPTMAESSEKENALV